MANGSSDRGAAAPTADRLGRAASESDRLSALSQRVEDLTTDIGSVLHANTSILFMAQQTLDVTLRALDPSPFNDRTNPTVEEIDEALTGPARQTARAIAALLAVASEPDRGAPLSESEVHTLEGHAELLEGFKEAVPVAEVRASTLRSVACDIQDILAAIPSGRLPRQKLRNLTRAAREVERIAAVSSVLQTRSAILQMDYTIRSFREFVTTDVRRAEQTTELQVSALLEEAHRQLTEYATSSEVDIRPRYQVGDARVRGIERELVRAFANLLHNAIKYSWRRDPHHRPWVGVSVHRDGSSICVVFENWGVPISEREIRDNLVFELGYRGKWSTDRGRLGTGIGLTDARDIALRHNGSITITSRPARSWGPDNRDHEEYYRQPFITTVTIALPEWV